LPLDYAGNPLVDIILLNTYLMEIAVSNRRAISQEGRFKVKIFLHRIFISTENLLLALQLPAIHSFS